MKRFLSIFLSFCFLFSTVGCGSSSLTPAQQEALVSVAITTFVAAMKIDNPGWQYAQLTADAGTLGATWTTDTLAQREAGLSLLVTDLQHTPSCTGNCPAYTAVAVGAVQSVLIIVEGSAQAPAGAAVASVKVQPKYSSYHQVRADWNKVAPEGAKLPYFFFMAKHKAAKAGK